MGEDKLPFLLCNTHLLLVTIKDFIMLSVIILTQHLTTVSE